MAMQAGKAAPTAAKAPAAAKPRPPMAAGMTAAPPGTPILPGILNQGQGVGAVGPRVGGPGVATPTTPMPTSTGLWG
jgi:hypothetical protein